MNPVDSANLNMWSPKLPKCVILQRIFAACPPWANILRACALISKRGKCCSVCGIKGTGHFLEFFALQRNASAEVFRFRLALEMEFPVLTSPWSMCRAPAAAQLFMLLYFKGGLSTGVFSPVPKSNAKRWNGEMNMWEALNLSCLAMTHLLTLFMGQFQLFWINQSLYYNVKTMSGGAVLLLGFKVKSPFCPMLLVLLSATHKTQLLILPPSTLHSSMDASLVQV